MGVVTCVISASISHPYYVYRSFQDLLQQIYPLFQVQQWFVLFAILLIPLLYCFLKFRSAASKSYVYDGRRLVAQSLMPTAQDPSVHNRGDETNQSDNTGVSLQSKQSLQVQVAPNLSEDVLLPNAKEAGHYSVPMYIGQYPFGTTQAVGTNIFAIPSNSFYGNNNFKRLFIDKRYAKYDVRFTINVTGNPMATGILAIASLPYPAQIVGSAGYQMPSYDPDWTDYYDRIISSNHVLVDVSVDGVYKIDMPFTYYANYFTTFDYSSAQIYAELAAVVVSPYLPATGQTSAINLEVYASLINIESTDTAPYNTQGADHGRLIAQSLISFGETNNTTVVTQLENCNDAAVPVNVTGDSLHATVPIGMSAGLDVPPDPRNAETSTLRMAYQKLISFWNKVDVHKTSSTPQECSEMTTSMAKDLRLNVDELSMDFFRGRWYSPNNFASSLINITTSTATGTQLFSYPLSPIPISNSSAGFGTNFATNATTDFSQWLSSFFRYWRGSMKFRVVIASNSFKRGKILICVNYATNPTLLPSSITSGTIDPRSLPHIIVDLSNADRIIDIDIPYKSIFEYMRVSNLVGGGSFDQKEIAIGQIAAYLVSPLQVSNGTATNINLNVFQCWGPDFEFYGLRNIPGAGPVAQSKLMVTGPETHETRGHMMVPCQSLQQIARTRPSQYGVYTITLDSPSTFGSEPLFLPIHPIFLSQDPFWSGILSMYSGMRGGYRLKLQFANINVGTTLRVQYYDGYYPIAGTGQKIEAITGASENFDNSQLSILNGSALNAAYGAYATIPQLSRVPVQQPTYLNAVLANTPYSIVSFGNPPIADIMVDPYSQPEVILEVPDPSPMYTTQQTIKIPSGATIGTNSTTTAYDPYKDRNIGFLCIIPQDNVNYANQTTIEPVPLPAVATVSVSLMAADDWRAFWYNGGPTNMLPQSFGYCKFGGTAYTYTHPGQ